MSNKKERGDDNKIQKGALLYAGKAKSLYTTDDPSWVVMQFRNDISGFNAAKRDKLPNKGCVNNYFNAFIMEYLIEQGIPTHFGQLLSQNETLVRRLTMLPIEVIVRNYTAGGLCRRLGVSSGEALNPPVFEYCLKNDELGDPMINESHIFAFRWATPEQLNVVRTLGLRINTLLTRLFLKANLLLADFKLEFGVFEDKLYVGDEFTPDGCRLWDKDTLVNFDKDRFRRDQGEVVKFYIEAARRLGMPLPPDLLDT